MLIMSASIHKIQGFFYFKYIFNFSVQMKNVVLLSIRVNLLKHIVLLEGWPLVPEPVVFTS